MTGYSQDQTQDEIVDNSDFDNADGSLAAQLTSLGLGWRTDEGHFMVSDNVHNIVGMSTTSRLASGDDESLTGQYQCNIGAHAFHRQNTITAKYGHLRVDVRGPWTGVAVQEIKTIKDPRITQVGVENFFLMQKCVATFEIYSEIANLQANIDNLTIPEPPVANETIHVDGEITGDTDVDVPIPPPGLANRLMDFLQSPQFIMLMIGVAAVAIGILVVYVKLKQKALQMATGMR